MLQVYGLADAEQWDRVVRSFGQYDTYWLSGYVKAFEIHGDGEPMLFHYDDGKTRGINVVMRRDIGKSILLEGKIPAGQYYDFSTPYGYGGWLTEGEDTAPLFAAYEKWCVKNRIVSEFVRFHPVVKNHQGCEHAYQVIPLGEVVALDLKDPDLIWENIASKNRNVIRKAVKNDVCIYTGRYPELYKQFREIYNSTMDKDEADPYYYFSPDFYKSVLEDLPENAQIFYAVKDDTIIAASIMLAANGKMNYHLSGSLREYSSLAATNLLLYKAALWGHANGCKTLYLGGGVGSGEDGLFKFKRSFYKGDLLRFHIGKKIFDRERYDEVVALSRTDDRCDQNSSYFPAYRAVRHDG